MRLLTSTLMAAAIALIAGVAQADTTAQGDASATVIAPISVTAQDALQFGKLVSGGTDGTITDGGTAAGGVTAVASTRSAGTFGVLGEANQAYTPTVDPTATLSNGPVNLTADLTHTQAANLSAGGTDTITVHGTLHVPANTAAGTYTGTYNVAVAY